MRLWKREWGSDTLVHFLKHWFPFHCPVAVRRSELLQLSTWSKSVPCVESERDFSSCRFTDFANTAGKLWVSPAVGCVFQIHSLLKHKIRCAECFEPGNTARLYASCLWTRFRDFVWLPCAKYETAFERYCPANAKWRSNFNQEGTTCCVCRKRGSRWSSHQLSFRFLWNWNLTFVYLQPDDLDHTERHHQHAAVAQHGQVLEGAARDLRHSQTGGGAHQERRVPPAAHHHRHGLSPVVSAQKSTQNDHKKVSGVGLVEESEGTGKPRVFCVQQRMQLTFTFNVVEILRTAGCRKTVLRWHELVRGNSVAVTCVGSLAKTHRRG